MSRIPDLSRLLQNLGARRDASAPASPKASGDRTFARDIQDELSLSLHHLAGVLSASRAAVHSAASGQLAQPRLSDSQAAIDAATGSIQRAEDLFESGGFTDGPAFHVLNVSPDVASYGVQRANLHPGQTLDVRVIVTQSAQQGGLYLSFGGASLDLSSATSSFSIEIGGQLGARSLSFTSGTTLMDVAAAVNAFASVTGVRAVVVASGAQSNGIRLEGEAFGRQSFASVRVINDGGIGGNHVGLYNLATTDFNAVNTTLLSDFRGEIATNGYADLGQDIRGTINGQAAAGHGRMLAIQNSSLAARITLTAGHAVGSANAQTLGAFSAFVIERE